MKRHKSLRASLFITPSLIIIEAFAIILIAFNLIVSQYTNSIAKEHIDSEFSRFSLYNKNEENWQFTKNESGYGLATTSVILDEAGGFIDPAPPWRNAEEEALARYIAAYYQENNVELKLGNTLTFMRENKTYHIRLGAYYGYYDGYVLFDDEKSADNNQYEILVYTDVTPLISFGNSINRTLWILMASVLLLALLLLFLRSYKLDSAFRALNTYIFMAGNRKTLPRKVRFEYEEFYNVGKTVRTMTEMLDQAESVQKQFFANASHELKTPLMSIQGYAEGLQSGKIEDQNKCLSIIVRESRKMAALINDILVLAKMDADDRKMTQEMFDFREMVLYCAGAAETSAQKKGIHLNVDIQEAPMPYRGNESELERAVMNILVNAMRYAKSAVMVFCGQDSKGISLIIADNGPGISPEDMPHIFERFYKGSGGNFGIGLSITQEVIRHHQGEIGVESMPGKTVFRVSLPALR